MVRSESKHNARCPSEARVPNLSRLSVGAEYHCRNQPASKQMPMNMKRCVYVSSELKINNYISRGKPPLIMMETRISEWRGSAIELAVIIFLN